MIKLQCYCNSKILEVNEVFNSEDILVNCGIPTKKHLADVKADLESRKLGVKRLTEYLFEDLCQPLYWYRWPVHLIPIVCSLQEL